MPISPSMCMHAQKHTHTLSHTLAALYGRHWLTPQKRRTRTNCWAAAGRGWLVAGGASGHHCYSVFGAVRLLFGIPRDACARAQFDHARPLLHELNTRAKTTRTRVVPHSNHTGVTTTTDGRQPCGPLASRQTWRLVGYVTCGARVVFPRTEATSGFSCGRDSWRHASGAGRPACEAVWVGNVNV